jgi:hypothetical protein
VAEPYLAWALVVGIAVGGAVVWFMVGRLPRRSDDIAPEELVAEAAWISRTIQSRGGIAPPELVEEVLQLHLEYVAGPPAQVEPERQADPG